MSTWAWTPRHITSALDGNWIRRPHGGQRDEDTLFEGISTDTRAIRPGEVFVAIKGDRFDGHDHVPAAIAAGASLLIVHRDPTADELADADDHLFVYRVEDTRRALLRLAAYYRRQLISTQVIAITGSCGKTTTKEIIHAVLGGTLRGTASPRSFNNDIGVPLTILAAKTTDQYLVVEAGTNASGELAQLAPVIDPDLCVLTSIGASHLEGLGSIEGVAREKATLLNHVRDGGMNVVNADAPFIRDFIRMDHSTILFGQSEQADLRLTRIDAVDDGVRFEVNQRSEWFIPLHGTHNAANALAAIAVARRLGLTDDLIARHLADVAPPPMRLAWTETGGLRFLNDAYNANPDSMTAALETFADLASSSSSSPTSSSGTGRRVAIIGDMLELGDKASALHEQLGTWMAESPRVARTIDHVICVGPMMATTHQAACRAGDSTRYSHVAGAFDENTIMSIANMLQPGDVVLLKASRGVGLERIIRVIESRATETQVQIEHREPAETDPGGRRS